MSTTITVIPGDGIGPEIMTATLRCLEALLRQHNAACFLSTETGNWQIGVCFKISRSS
ncbi:MAG: hypothetical protein BMS9Abin30_1223 [Gammaproteobacteria bacterium]|nr:MAG: hypothetical protein BMS9Abin30_1223 [Gammaproteobacteria bacterium]